MFVCICLFIFVTVFSLFVCFVICLFVYFCFCPEFDFLFRFLPMTDEILRQSMTNLNYDDVIDMSDESSVMTNIKMSHTVFIGSVSSSRPSISSSVGCILK